MRLLLDTHALLWALTNDPRLSEISRENIRSIENQIFVSLASLWEISIKVSLGKLELPQDFDALFPSSLDEAGLELLPISIPHLSLVRRLPFHHRDPFDRILIAQGPCEALTVVTHDPLFAPYNVPTIW